MFTDQSGIKYLSVIEQKDIPKYSETKNVPLNKPWVKEDIKSEMRKYFEMNKNINTSKFHNAAKAVFIGKCTG